MKLLREYIREKLLTESVDPKIMSMIDKLENNGGHVEILPDRVIVWEPPLSDKSWPTTNRHVAVVAYETPHELQAGRCAGADSIVTSSHAKTGLGPLAYDVAIEQTGGLGLMPDRYTVSNAAAAVWDKYYSSRPDVQAVQTDDHDNSLTPENDDNCDQKSAMHNQGNYHFEKSSLSKVYKKSGTPVMDELRKRGMLK